MPFYHRLGTIPPKRHSVYRQPDGKLYYEELIGNQGFVGPSSLLYHIERPTQVLRVQEFRALQWESEEHRVLRHRHFRTHRLASGSSPVLDRAPLLFNNDVAISIVAPRAEDRFFYRNAQGDEIVYVTEGEGTLETQMGDMPFRPGDYLVIPRGILHRYRLSTGPYVFLVIESAGYVRTPKRYRNEHGQLLEHAPYAERDIRRPEQLVPRHEDGEFHVLVKKDFHLTEFSWITILSMSSVGMATTIHGLSIFMISNPASADFICPLRCTKPSKVMALSCARSARARMTSTRRPFRLHTIIRTSCPTRCSTTRTPSS